MPPPSDGAGEYNENWYRYPNFYSVSYYSNGGSQFGNQLDIGIERKFKSSLTFQAGYAWARSLTDIMGGDVAGAIENGYNRRRDWGPETDPIPNNKFTVAIGRVAQGRKTFGAEEECIENKGVS